jgi:hypothetical protein
MLDNIRPGCVQATIALWNLKGSFAWDRIADDPVGIMKCSTKIQLGRISHQSSSIFIFWLLLQTWTATKSCCGCRNALCLDVSPKDYIVRMHVGWCEWMSGKKEEWINQLLFTINLNLW